MRLRSFLMSFLTVFLAAAVLCGAVYHYSLKVNEMFTTTFYTISSNKIDNKVRIALLTDLHLHEYGKDNVALVDRISALEPDIIAIAGDLTTQSVSNHDIAIKLVEQLVDIAPVYYSAGNHEYSDILYNKDSTLINDIVETGAVYLDNEYLSVDIKGTKFIIGGVCKNGSDILKYTVTRRMIEDMSAESGFKLLLSHYPEAFMSGMSDYVFDLVLSGHAHGGQIRLPKIGGLYSPDQGFLPRYTEGIHLMSGSTVVISRGLGDSETIIPRINNQPELVVIDID